MTDKLALEKAIDFIDSLTADPLLLADDVEMTLADVQEHARIELASIRKVMAEAPPETREPSAWLWTHPNLAAKVYFWRPSEDHIRVGWIATPLYERPAPPEAPLQGWQDIRTAPHGPDILVWNGRRRHVASFDVVEGQWISSFKTVTKRLWVTPTPTHWQPLPDVPGATEGQL